MFKNSTVAKQIDPLSGIYEKQWGRRSLSTKMTKNCLKRVEISKTRKKAMEVIKKVEIAI